VTGGTRQWLLVGVIVGGLALGAWAMVRFRPETDQVVVGSRAPDFKVVDLTTGDSLQLRQRYGGTVTLVNIWATWCQPCRVEMPAIQQAYARLKPRGFKVAAVSVDEGSPDDVRAFAREFGLTFDILHDRSGLIQQKYQLTGLPETFLLDKDGVIMKREIGAHDWASPTNLALINRLLDDAGAPRVTPLDTVSTTER
jgi:cytochrome c biogenesis protein CcmG, thiol:disulfide interchange protein DsbE